MTGRPPFAAGLAAVLAALLSPSAQAQSTNAPDPYTDLSQYLLVNGRPVPSGVLTPAAGVARPQGNLATLDQTGTANTATITQNGFGNTGAVVQLGANNVATLDATGLGNSLSATQIGNNDAASLSAQGENVTLSATQLGSNLSVAVQQVGVGKSMVIVQGRR